MLGDSLDIGATGRSATFIYARHALSGLALPGNGFGNENLSASGWALGRDRQMSGTFEQRTIGG